MNDHNHTHFFTNSTTSSGEYISSYYNTDVYQSYNTDVYQSYNIENKTIGELSEIVDFLFHVLDMLYRLKIKPEQNIKDVLDETACKIFNSFEDNNVVSEKLNRIKKYILDKEIEEYEKERGEFLKEEDIII